MAEVRVSPEARADLAEIDEYGAETFGDKVAADYSRCFNDIWDRLERYPKIGARQPTLGRLVRCITHRCPRIFYEVEGEVVLILRIFHHARDVKPSLLQ